MCWVGTYGNFRNAEEFITSEFDNLFGQESVVDYAIRSKSPNFRKATCYVVFKNSKNESMACAIYLQKRGNEYLYKAETENMGPCEAKCPQRLLMLLEHTANERAIEWRDRCWNRK